ncbi:response regulator [Roseobacter cerasinus]|uniref:Response regulator n=1 Tax=Roseobacter cerasinus TaxID=2602289 RepID=A0A640VVP1_9RHOB|nr:response regulator [Roseobacter cerasinus]GFE51917.1 response regulator [Roseobacter cerasinus]
MPLIPEDVASKSVFVLEDTLLIAEGIAMQLRGLGFQDISTALSLQEAWADIDHETPDIALLDLNLGKGENSLTIARALLDRKVAVIVITGYAGVHEGTDEVRQSTVLTKPFNSDELATAILASLS